MFAFSRFRFFLIAFATALIVSVATPAQAVTPAAATGLKVSVTTNSATISWSKAANATKYRVCLITYKTESPCAIVSAKTAGTKMTMTNLKPNAGADYFAKVYSYNTSNRTVSGLIAINLRAPAKPDAPRGLTQTIGTSTAAISWAAATNAETYSVCLMTTSTTESCAFRSARSTATRATFDNLRTTSGADYYYRVFAYNNVGTGHSAKVRFDLPVGPLASFTITKVRTAAVAVTWSPDVNAETYRIQVATASDMKTGLKTFTAASPSTGRSLIGLTPGVTYYLRIRGENGIIAGVFTTPLVQKLPTDPFNVTVITYNLCGQDKCVTSSNGMKKWSTRKPLAGAVARGTKAQIIATQESHTSDTNFGTQLPGYTLGAYYSSKSLYFVTARFTKLRSGTITLDSTRKRYAVWVELRDNTTRTPFIVSDAHLEPYKGKTRDDLRKAQTNVLITQIARMNPARLPVVYAGDFNSNKDNADTSKYAGGYDAPTAVFGANGIADAVDRTSILIRLDYNSANQARNPPLRYGDHVDHIFVDPRIRVNMWGVVLRMSGSRYATPFATDHNPVKVNVTIPGTS